MSFDAKLIAAVLGFLFNLICVEGLMNYIDQTKTHPLVQLTLIQSGCEFVKRNSIDADESNGICTIKVRYRKNEDDEGGVIEINGSSISVNSNQVVGRHQLDDGSDAPWSDEHKMALEWLLGPALFMIFILIALSLVKDLPESKKKPDKTSTPQPGMNAHKQDEGSEGGLSISETSNASNASSQEDK